MSVAHWFVPVLVGLRRRHRPVVVRLVTWIVDVRVLVLQRLVRHAVHRLVLQQGRLRAPVNRFTRAMQHRNVRLSLRRITSMMKSAKYRIEVAVKYF